MRYKVLLHKNKEKPNICVEEWAKDVTRESSIAKNTNGDTFLQGILTEHPFCTRHCSGHLKRWSMS